MDFDFRQILFGVGSTAVQSVRTGSQQGDNYAQAAARLLQHAGKWSAVSQSGIACSTKQRTPIGTLEACSSRAIGACVICNQPTCFNHSMISPHDGTQICFGCVGRMQQSHQADTPVSDFSDEQKIAECLLVLGLTGEPSWAQIQAVYKALAKEHHPDRHPEGRRKAHEKKFKKITEAYEWLKSNYQQKAA